MDQIYCLPINSSAAQVNQKFAEIGCRLVSDFETEFEHVYAYQVRDQLNEFEYSHSKDNSIHYLSFRAEFEQSLLNDILGRVELLTDDDLGQLTQSKKAAHRLLAIELMAVKFEEKYYPLLNVLKDDSEQKVANAAKKLITTVVGSKSDWLSTYHSMIHPHDRRQFIRWLIYDYANTSDKNSFDLSTTEEILKLGLQDQDWEVRVSTIIAVARMNLIALFSLVEKVDLNISAGTLPNKKDRELINGVKRVALMILTKTQPQNVDINNIKHQRWLSLYEAVKSENINVSCYITQLVYYFSTPANLLSEEHVQPFCEGIVLKDDKFYLSNSDIELVWIPVGEYFVNHLNEEDNYIKVLQEGFFISRFPLMADESNLLTASIEGIRSFLKDLSQSNESIEIRLPNYTEWQVASRSMDVRNYPWGWGIEDDWTVRASEFGLGLFWPEIGELICEENDYFLVDKFGFKVVDYEQIQREKVEKLESSFRIVINKK
ncbi:hypothetical protein FLL45_20390 [Aliikangiella marina]|uniref:Uncharacterized protein n=1 Tax=Aliikangiella marina TaxID=1712262 RepID=A0A545T2R2_9GAMM|nr:hypothetical protein [Aliikangiella marina]TQV71513.1 hypothetical protein FLL45_20390 [Aliikangiella marina]